MRLKQAVIVLVLVLPLFVASLSAQAGIVFGAVKDKVTGEGIDEVVIRIEGTTVNRKYKTKTNKEGEFIHIGVSRQGVYRVIAEKDGWQGAFIEGVRPTHDRNNKDFHILLEMEKGAARTMAFEMTAEEIAANNKAREDAEKANAKIAALSKSFNDGVAAFDAEDFTLARDHFLKATETAPDEPAVWANLGRTYARLEEDERAIEAYLKAIALKPSDAAFYQNLGGVYSKLGRTEEAKAAYEKSIELAGAVDPKVASDSYYNMAVGFINARQDALAEAPLRKAIELNAQNEEAHYQLGIILLNLGNMEESIKALEQYLKLSPNGPNAAVAKELVQSLK